MIRYADNETSIIKEEDSKYSEIDKSKFSYKMSDTRKQPTIK